MINENGAVFCAFDTETTGLSYKKDKIIELGAVRFDKSGVLASYNSFVHVDFPLPPIITQITHITDQMLIDAPTIQKVMADFEEFSKGCVLVAHNAQFDWNFVNAERTALGMKELKNKAIAAVFGGRNENRRAGRAPRLRRRARLHGSLFARRPRHGLHSKIGAIKIIAPQ